MKKYAILVLVILALVVFASGCINTGNNTTSISTNAYSGNGVSFNYPSNWQQMNDSALSSIVLVAVGDPNTLDNSTGTFITGVGIQKVAMPTNGTTLKQVYDSTYAQWAAGGVGYQSISDTTTTVDGTTAYVNTHTINIAGKQVKEKAVWLEKNGSVYVILCGSSLADFDAQQANFDMIINSFKVQ